MIPEPITAVPHLSPRAPDAHKGTFGHVLVVAGSRDMAGAAVLCASAALRGGAGTVQLAVPEAIQPTVAAGQICATTAGLPSTKSGQFAAHALPALFRLAEQANVVAIGPGLGRGESVRWIVNGLVEQCPLPLVIDADGLNALAPLAKGQTLRPGRATVLTPHPGELARLLQTTAGEIQTKRETTALRFATDCGAVLLLKGSRTLVTDGARLYLNRTGNPGMATGGSGDVLTGLIAALVAQKLDSFAAAQLGAYLHGLAGDLAREEFGEEALLASDLLRYIPAAFVRYRSK